MSEFRTDPTSDRAPSTQRAFTVAAMSRGEILPAAPIPIANAAAAAIPTP